MATIYESAPEVAELAVSLIAEHHPDLLGAPIVYLFMDPAPKAKGRTILGRARKVQGLNAFLVALAAGEATDDEDHSFFDASHSFWAISMTQLVIHQGDPLAFGRWRDDVRTFVDACAASCVVVS